ncbi:DNA alkylation repair protein [Winogradskyella sp. A2]|uniref:DNA alkylation repair protein n=1 Tax=Winogradskyella sp. A2 TaxID=3366944 RepID=UPI00398C57DE
MSFVAQLISSFENHRNEANAIPMRAYMKHKFAFFGIKSMLRKSLLREVVNANKGEVKSNLTEISKTLFKKPERELHYCAMEIYARFKKRHYIKSDIMFIEFLITENSHWDTVDFIAKHILGQFLMELPEMRDEVIQKYSTDDNMWLNRSAILFQLGYKEKTDFSILSNLAIMHKDSNEFFIKKAIGWALREFAKYNSYAVINFVESTDLKPLSKREALKHFR